MTTPTKQAILARATELLMQEQQRNGLGESLPEECELKEAGFLDKAKQELMTGVDAQAGIISYVDIENGTTALNEVEKLKRTIKELKEQIAQVKLPETVVVKEVVPVVQERIVFKERVVVVNPPRTLDEGFKRLEAKVFWRDGKAVLPEQELPEGFAGAWVGVYVSIIPKRYGR